MRIKLLLAAFLFLLPSNICCSKENLTVERREAGVLIDENDYEDYPLCGDKPMATSTYTCHCGNRTLSGFADLSGGDYYCCVPPSADGQDQCKYTDFIDEDDPSRSDVRCENGEVRHKTEPCHQNCWNSYRQSEKLLPSIRTNVLRSLQ